MVWLVVRFNHLEKMMEFVNGNGDIPYMKWKIKKCMKPPTSNANIPKLQKPIMK